MLASFLLDHQAHSGILENQVPLEQLLGGTCFTVLYEESQLNRDSFYVFFVSKDILYRFYMFYVNDKCGKE